MISTISGHAEARIEVPNKRLIFAAAAPSASTANHKAERFGAGRAGSSRTALCSAVTAVYITSAVVAGGAQPAAHGVRRNTQPESGLLAGARCPRWRPASRRRPQSCRHPHLGRVRTRPAAVPVRAAARRVRELAPSLPDCSVRWSGRHRCAPTVAE